MIYNYFHKDIYTEAINEVKMALTIHNQSKIEQAIDRTDLADSTKMQYKKAINNAINAGIDLTNLDELRGYADTLSKSSKAFLKAAIRLWSKEIELMAKAGATPDNVDVIQATIYRFEALNESISVKSKNGTKAHTWLSQSEVRELAKYCNDDTLICQRDKVVLGLLVGAGLRCNELANLTFDDIKLQGNRTVLQVEGKGAKDRVIPINDKLAQFIADWQGIVGNGNIARSITKGGKIGDRMSSRAIFNIVAKAGKSIGKDELAPHDLRRSYAQIGFEAGVPITQISKLLGHSSVATTQKYLNLDLDLETTISDFVPF